MEHEEKYELLEKLAEEIDIYFSESECDVIVQDEESINIYLDLPNIQNYNDFITEVERFFAISKNDIEDFEIDGDYEGQIIIVYEGE